jgi:GTP-binding protein
VIVANKMDLEGAKEKLSHFKKRYKKIEIIPVSGESGDGIEKLKTRLGEIVVGNQFEPVE